MAFASAPRVYVTAANDAARTVINLGDSTALGAIVIANRDEHAQWRPNYARRNFFQGSAHRRTAVTHVPQDS